MTQTSDVRAALLRLKAMAASTTSEEEARLISSRAASIARQYRVKHGIGLPGSPLDQAEMLDDSFVRRPHLEYLSDRLVQAVQDVERGENRRLVVSMPPRAGKSTLISQQTPLWLLRRHPEWKLMTASYDGSLTASWARKIRFTIEDRPALGVALARDGGAGARWETLEGGGMYATAVGGSLVGRGANVMLIDDPVKDYVEAHSPRHRENLWNWWLGVAQTRLEPPYLVIVVATRWHEDDLIGRLLSRDYEGDPRDWERISLPALADEPNDALGRAAGQPLYLPLLNETEDEAVRRWESTRQTVGSYTFAAQYQQRPAPAKGAIFDSDWWRFWTRDASRVSEDSDRVVLLDPEEDLSTGRWLDSWDCAFKGGEDTDWVVGQRWAIKGANRYLIAQQRGRWSFTQTIERMRRWASPDSPWGSRVHERLIEDTANGPAIIDTLKNQISGLKPVKPKTSKEARARAITPEVESGNVLLPYPGDPGNEWVNDLLSELRNFPHDQHDDQVDALTQALSGLRQSRPGHVTVPGRSNGIARATPRIPRRTYSVRR